MINKILHEMKGGDSTNVIRDLIEKKNYDGIKKHLEKNNSDARDVVFYAQHSDDLEAIKIAIEYKPDLTSIKFADGKNLLHHLIEKRKDEFVKFFIIEQIFDIESTDEFKRTPLFFAIKESNDELAQFLISKGANVDALDSDNRTPLYSALSLSDQETVKQIINKSKKLNHRDNEGTTPLMQSVHTTNLNIFAFELLLKKNVLMNTVDNTGHNVLCYATQRMPRGGLVHDLFANGGLFPLINGHFCKHYIDYKDTQKNYILQDLDDNPLTDLQYQAIIKKLRFNIKLCNDPDIIAKIIEKNDSLQESKFVEIIHFMNNNNNNCC